MSGSQRLRFVGVIAATVSIRDVGGSLWLIAFCLAQGFSTVKEYKTEFVFIQLESITHCNFLFQKNSVFELVG